MPIMAPAFRFRESDHSYWVGDERLPSITQLMDLGGLVVAKDYFTEASRIRGREVHSMCMDFDLGTLALPLPDDQDYRGYVLAYVEMVRKLKPDWDDIEIADWHETLRYAGRKDRGGRVFGRRTVCELKTGSPAKHHPIQTALQAMLDEQRYKLPAAMFQRLTVYLRPTGRFTVQEHTDTRDFDHALELVRRFCQ